MNNEFSIHSEDFTIEDIMSTNRHPIIQISSEYDFTKINPKILNESLIIDDVALLNVIKKFDNMITFVISDQNHEDFKNTILNFMK